MDFQIYDDIFNRDNYPAFKKNFLNNFKPLDDKACVCLSGKQYKDCCKKDIEEAIKNRKTNDEVINENLKQLYFQKNSKLISFKVEKKAVKKKNISYCSAEKVFGDCDFNNNNVHSHTLSRGNILSNLSDNGELIRFNDHTVIDADKISNQISDYYSDVSIDEASVTVSFCKTHDEELFADIEKDGNTEYLNTEIQNLEYSLKAITFDIYYKIMSILYMARLIEENKYIVCNPDGSASRYFTDYRNMVKALFELYPIMLKILNEIKDLKERKLDPKLKSICFKLPIQKVNFSLSEVIMLGNTPCFVNVINSLLLASTFGEISANNFTEVFPFCYLEY